MPRGQRDTMAFPHVAEAAQHQAQISWFCQKGPLAELRLCTSFLQYHWPSGLRARHFPPQPVLGPASKGQTVNASDKVQARMMSLLPQPSSMILRIPPLPPASFLMSQTRRTAALFRAQRPLHVPQERTHRKQDERLECCLLQLCTWI